MIELLAPAKDKICAKAAIDYGADAVYIGASDFSARKGAPNSLEDIKEIVDYAHIFGVKIYVTINTILTDIELIQAVELVKELKNIGVDAIIAQDMGLFEKIKDIIPVHASTQCDNRNSDKVKFLENAGFSRVILARELSIKQIEEIREKTDVELEAFIHGALCVSYSGNCYLSYAIGGRSANRGECAQTCRKEFSLVNEKGEILAKNKHLLCLKDFNASEYLEKLANAGVMSFKIEGRLKDINYIKNVVGFYRKELDKLELKNSKFQKSSFGKVKMDFEPDLEKTFNRGFTNYFLDGKRKNIYSFDSQKSIGEYIGVICNVGNKYFEISDYKNQLNPQDGLCFISKNGLSGVKVNRVERGKIFPNRFEKIEKGLKVYRNSDVEFDKILKKSKTCRKITVNIKFYSKIIKIEDENKNFEEISYDFEEIAKNSDKMKENIISQFIKSGGSHFEVNKIEILTDKIPFLPISKLNELRRELFDKLTKKIQKFNTVANLQKRKDTNYPKINSDYRDNILNKVAKEFYEKHNCKVKEFALESKKTNAKGKAVITSKHCLKYAFGLCKTPEKLFLIDEKNKRYELKFDCQKCEMQVIF